MIEQRLESLEREIIRLNITMQELITLYLDTQSNPILGDLPKNQDFVPSIVKSRNKRASQQDAIQYSITQVRDITNEGIEILGEHYIRSLLSAYEAKSVAHLSEDQYFPYCQNVLRDISEHED